MLSGYPRAGFEEEGFWFFYCAYGFLDWHKKG